MGYSPWGLKESDTTEQLCFFLGPTKHLLNQKLGLSPTPQTVKNPAELLLGIKSTETNRGLRVESLHSSLLCGIPQ